MDYEPASQGRLAETCRFDGLTLWTATSKEYNQECRLAGVKRSCGLQRLRLFHHQRNTSKQQSKMMRAAMMDLTIAPTAVPPSLNEPVWMKAMRRSSWK